MRPPRQVRPPAPHTGSTRGRSPYSTSGGKRDKRENHQRPPGSGAVRTRRGLGDPQQPPKQVLVIGPPSPGGRPERQEVEDHPPSDLRSGAGLFALLHRLQDVRPS